MFEEVRKKNKKLLIGGYDHSAPHSIPTHLIYTSFSPDFLYVNGTSQINFSQKFLNWPRKKLKLVPSLRYPKKLKLDFNNIVFLPYNIFNEKVVVEEFKKIISDIPKVDLKIFKNQKSSNDAQFKKAFEFKI